MQKLIENFQVISIMGMAKNVGKTTVLNYLINLDNSSPYAITSIGLDGEAVDNLTGTNKPRIYVKKGAIIATTVSTLKASDITIKVIASTNIETALGEVVIVEALSDGYVLLAGASIKEDVKKVIEIIKTFDPIHIFIDGAIDRSSFADSSLSDALIIATGANYSTNLEKLVNDTIYKVNLFDESNLYFDDISLDFYKSKNKVLVLLNDSSILPSKNSILSDDLILNSLENAKMLMIDGALTENTLNLIINKTNNKPLQIILRNPMSLFISERSYTNLIKHNIKIYFHSTSKVIAVTLNPYTVNNALIDKELFMKMFKTKCQIPVFDVVGDPK